MAYVPTKQGVADAPTKGFPGPSDKLGMTEADTSA